MAAIVRYIRTVPQGWAIKTHGGPFTAGQPDITGCVQGRSVHLEVKRDGKEQATPLQMAMLKTWSDAGAITGVVSSVEEVRRLFMEYDVVTK